MLNSSLSICIMKHKDMHSYSSYVQNWQRIASWLLCAWIRYIIDFFSVLSFLFTSPFYFREIQLNICFQFIHTSILCKLRICNKALHYSKLILQIPSQYDINDSVHNYLYETDIGWYFAIWAQALSPCFSVLPPFLWVYRNQTLFTYKYAMIILYLLLFSVIFNYISLSFE